MPKVVSFILVVWGVAWLAAGNPALAAPRNITQTGCIDMERVLASVRSDKLAKALLSGGESDFLSEVRAIASRIEVLKTQLKEEKETLTKDEQEALQQQLDEQKEMYEDLIQAEGDGFGGSKNDHKKLSDQVYRHLYRVVERTAIERGFSLILEKARAGVLYASSQVDITQDVLEALKAMKQKRLGVQGD